MDSRLVVREKQIESCVAIIRECKIVMRGIF